MKSPDKLFKSPEELQGSTTKKKNFISDAEFERKIKEIASAEYDSISELNNAKKEASDLFNAKREQGDDEVADSMESVLTKIKRRKDVKSGKSDKTDITMADNDLVDAKTIEIELNKIIEKKYDGNIEALKRDKSRLNKMVAKYKEEEGADAERNLEEIEFLFKKLRGKDAEGKENKKYDEEEEGK